MAHLAKYPRTAMAAMLAHYERVPELERGYRRDNIDNDRTSLNYMLSPARTGGAQAWLDNQLAQLARQPRKNAIVMCDVVVTAPRDLREGDERLFFTAMYDELCEMWGGEDRCVLAAVHMDESMPHMHFAFVPITEDGRLSARDLVSRAALRDMHPRLQRAADEALGYHVSVTLDEDAEEDRALSRLPQQQYRAARRALRRRDEALAETARAEDLRDEALDAALESRQEVRRATAAVSAAEAQRQQVMDDLTLWQGQVASARQATKAANTDKKAAEAASAAAKTAKEAAEAASASATAAMQRAQRSQHDEEERLAALRDQVAAEERRRRDAVQAADTASEAAAQAKRDQKTESSALDALRASQEAVRASCDEAERRRREAEDAIRVATAHGAVPLGDVIQAVLGQVCAVLREHRGAPVATWLEQTSQVVRDRTVAAVVAMQPRQPRRRGMADVSGLPDGYDDDDLSM